LTSTFWTFFNYFFNCFFNFLFGWLYFFNLFLLYHFLFLDCFFLLFFNFLYLFFRRWRFFSNFRRTWFFLNDFFSFRFLNNLLNRFFNWLWQSWNDLWRLNFGRSHFALFIIFCLGYSDADWRLDTFKRLRRTSNNNILTVWATYWSSKFAFINIFLMTFTPYITGFNSIFSSSMTWTQRMSNRIISRYPKLTILIFLTKTFAER